MRDNDFLLLIQQGNLNAFEELYLNMQPRLYAFSRKFIDDKEISKDIVQEIFFEFWENRNSLAIKSSLNAYLFRTLHNKCLNYIRTLKVQEKYSNYVDIKLKETELHFYDHETEGYKSIFFEEVQEILKASIENLPESCREIFHLSRVVGLSNKEIANKLNISVRTVENQIYRALKVLKNDLKDYLPLLPLLLSRFL